MRIVSWNLNHWARPANLRARAWEYLRDGLEADVALTQESVPPPDLNADRRVYRPLHDTHPRYQWGTAVVAVSPGITVRERRRVPLREWDLGERKDGALPESHPGASAVADIIDANGKRRCTAVSFYGQWEGVADRQRYYSCAKVHRILSDLTGILATVRKQPLLVAGDFNLTTQIAYDGQTRAETEGAAAAFARIQAWGLSDLVRQTRDSRSQLASCTCPAPAGCGHIQTYRHANKVGSRPIQLDYAFVSPALASARCLVVHDDEAWGLSDHCPIVIEID